MEILFSDPFLKNQNGAYIWINILMHHTACFYGMPSFISTRRLTKWWTNILSITTLVLHNWFQRYTLSYFYGLLQGLGLISPDSFLNFFLNLYIPSWLLKSFKFIVLRLLQIHLWVKNLNLFICTHALKQDSPSDFYHYPPGWWELPIPPGPRFLKIFFPWAERGERIMAKIKKGIGHKFW